MTDQTMTIRQMCDAFGVTPRTLRFYESKELLSPRRDGQKRLYSRRDRARLKLILRGKKFGCSLEVIRQLLDLYEIGDKAHTQMEQSYRVGLDRLKVLKDQRADLDATIAELSEYLAWGEELLNQMRMKRTG